MTANLKISAIMILLAGVVLAVAAGQTGPDVVADQPTTTDDDVAVLRDDSHRLSVATTGDVTLVEFLDFECEACAAAFPFIEELRGEYGDRVTFVARYFPLPGHPNSETAAIAVEAAARQGAFEAMYQRLFETQEQWSHGEESQAAVFRDFAADLGLDLDEYDAAVADPATLERVLRDKTDGIALGVTGTPTFFLNGEKLDVASTADFRAALDAAIRG